MSCASVLILLTGVAAADTPVRQPWGPSAGLQQGNALASVVSVYRNHLWQRVPKLLLVEVRAGHSCCCTRCELRSKLSTGSRGRFFRTACVSWKHSFRVCAFAGGSGFGAVGGQCLHGASLQVGLPNPIAPLEYGNVLAHLQPIA